VIAGDGYEISVLPVGQLFAAMTGECVVRFVHQLESGMDRSVVRSEPVSTRVCSQSLTRKKFISSGVFDGWSFRGKTRFDCISCFQEVAFARHYFAK